MTGQSRPHLPEPFEKAEVEYARLKNLVLLGQMTNEQLDAALQAMVIDYRGRRWMIGANTRRGSLHQPRPGGLAPKSPPAHTATPTIDTTAHGVRSQLRRCPAVASQGAAYAHIF